MILILVLINDVWWSLTENSLWEGTELEKGHAFFKHFFIFNVWIGLFFKKEEWHASWFMRHFCLLRTFLRTLFSEIIRKIDQEKKDVREIVTMTKSEVFFQLWQKKVILRTNFGLSFVIAMHWGLPISNYRKCLILGLIVKVYEAMKIENCLNTFFCDILRGHGNAFYCS